MIQAIWHNFIRRPLGILGLVLLAIFVFMALYAPFLASSKPICVAYNGTLYFPLFRYLLSTVFFTKKIDIFFNLLGLFFPFFFERGWFKPLSFLFVVLFIFFGFFADINPASSPYLNQQKEAFLLQLDRDNEEAILPNWDFDLEYMNDYAKLNLVLENYNRKRTHEQVNRALGHEGYTRYSIDLAHEKERIEKLESIGAKNELQYIIERRAWLEQQQANIRYILWPLFSTHHWEDDVGGEQSQNLQLPFNLDTRINRKDLLSALIFGSRISLFVGILSTLLALGIGLPLGLVAGYYGNRLDMLLCRFVEVWEAMPVFFMLLLIVAILQTKSIFVVVVVISIFSWMSAFRFVRAETFRQRELLYVDASKAIGFPDSTILLRHILPNSILAVVALLPFDIMAAVTREAGLAFLGLGEEVSCSWGVLMDEGRVAFPADTSLLWPPAIILTLLLIAIAFVGQALHAAMDPKSQE